MSWITEIILYIGYDNEDRMDEVNKYFEEYDRGGLVSLNSTTLPHLWYGGDWDFGRPVYVGSFNHVRLDKFLEHLRSLDLPDPDTVQIIFADEMGDFKILKITDIFEG